ncbi:hypothetical protein A3H10_01535 [Candidatus Uhrbacteria bacterium RIFCSPLOWO2_12_FULL_46_10]|uniref:Uncharacterized protein n=1 Tax=Candidatus Uhrbacteria bacterium RIFCSPLOWO2_01_FULL_47_25 TaxID=1802402 RepID=A0A1F7UWG5_9BACT|nr:MAG: hypothetical protein A2752_00215 [Candidatus Uhrbacteria bacterium RIFCSPHIGHO2_01_FULL_46_23]OGL68209.1 MAG: hypothetical protein A3D60_00250 [Candidatus Uhrbacteria bacterium RIFCSPHIGHO2_02_FULL_47_29]OGL75378.1 MAG: hypothetical protein A3E96_04495 [Candidatus Uhrbacteria bacterium RIFCSPHIGHO2_12_FULL_46_13]OGL81997.1 MAG: hypothetical protein A2936_05525 [Candidatus Uhrbacteria bacterium RIFCSPLOWO2_01_FULL_47_25]OGL86072.1 MAG: hypothetical protein A3I37_04065 [Candidatus Uhrbact
MQIRFQRFRYSIFYILYSGWLRHLSPSWQFFFICLGLVIGIALGNFISPPLVYLYIGGWGLVIVAILCYRRHLLACFGSLVMLALIIGVARSEIFHNLSSSESINQLVGQKHLLQGQVVGVPARQNRSIRYDLKLDLVDEVISSASGRTIAVVARPFPEVMAGDRLKLTCEITADKNAAQPTVICLFPETIIQPHLSRNLVSILGVIKESYVRSLTRIMPEPAVGFVTGLLIGGRSGLNQEWRDALNITGTAHLVALSGFNVTIIASFLLIVLKTITAPRRWRTVIVGAILFLFVTMVGAEASIVRAAIMGMLVVIANQSGRASSSRNALMLAAVVMLLIEPTLLVQDIGFQLSFLATLGMLYLYPLLNRLAQRWPNLLGFKAALLMAVSAEIFVTPLILYYFGRLSLVAPAVNMLVVPPIAFIMFFGFLGGLVGLIVTPLGQIIGFSGWVGAIYVLKVIDIASRLPVASVEMSISLWFLVVYYLILGGWLVWYNYNVRFLFPRVAIGNSQSNKSR